MATLEQITQRTALKAEIVAKALESLPVAIIVSDDKGIIHLVNRQTEILFGYDRTELMGSSVETLIPEELREIHVKHRTQYIEEPHSRIMGWKLKCQKKNGKLFLADITLGAIVTTDGLYIVVGLMRHPEDASA